MSFTGNTQYGGLTATAAAGFFFGTSTASGVITDNTVVGNTIVLPTGATGRGIWQQCNAASTSCGGNLYGSNKIFSDGTAGAQAVRIENNTGTTQDNQVSMNKITGFPANGYYALSGTVGVTIEDRNGMLFANAPAGAAGLNGSMIYLTDATIANPCAGSGSGAMAKYLNNIRVCN
jgi:hypothetical protein